MLSADRRAVARVERPARQKSGQLSTVREPERNQVMRADIVTRRTAFSSSPDCPGAAANAQYACFGRLMLHSAPCGQPVVASGVLPKDGGLRGAQCEAPVDVLLTAGGQLRIGSCFGQWLVRENELRPSDRRSRRSGVRPFRRSRFAGPHPSLERERSARVTTVCTCIKYSDFVPNPSRDERERASGLQEGQAPTTSAMSEHTVGDRPEALGWRQMEGHEGRDVLMEVRTEGWIRLEVIQIRLRGPRGREVD